MLNLRNRENSMLSMMKTPSAARIEGCQKTKEYLSVTELEHHSQLFDSLCLGVKKWHRPRTSGNKRLSSIFCILKIPEFRYWQLCTVAVDPILRLFIRSARWHLDVTPCNRTEYWACYFDLLHLQFFYPRFLLFCYLLGFRHPHEWR